MGVIFYNSKNYVALKYSRFFTKVELLQQKASLQYK